MEEKITFCEFGPLPVTNSVTLKSDWRLQVLLIHIALQIMGYFGYFKFGEQWGIDYKQPFKVPKRENLTHYG